MTRGRRPPCKSSCPQRRGPWCPSYRGSSSGCKCCPGNLQSSPQRISKKTGRLVKQPKEKIADFNIYAIRYINVTVCIALWCKISLEILNMLYDASSSVTSGEKTNKNLNYFTLGQVAGRLWYSAAWLPLQFMILSRRTSRIEERSHFTMTDRILYLHILNWHLPSLFPVMRVESALHPLPPHATRSLTIHCSSLVTTGFD